MDHAFIQSLSKTVEGMQSQLFCPLWWAQLSETCVVRPCWVKVDCGAVMPAQGLICFNLVTQAPSSAQLSASVPIWAGS